ncbi:putative glycerophosphoryl diester phosphodiesterase 1 [Ruminiclostridium hungatei]|uniref:Putative glycerophosphoryl diester phosphodiesterase 1 n=1 Tax=Ruminiclostridium hungatei TaxID=48256 RepID=A0A1V4SIZ3_RUMHU|nr:glycerophosphodiester phosphodiesterase [Ruminiclostridium hungatei]OPX43858.1 putative glycerophosphoryl diester phosphodiesterase 1 [Ruminiclostridium hungatei]
MNTLIWAHRGASAQAPENSMEAFRLANRQQADGIELDIHMTRDGHLVVAHDETIDRCSNGSGRIIDMTLKELLTYDFSNHMDGYRNIRIPTLEEVLHFVKGTRLTVNIELKSGLVTYEGIEEKAIRLVSDMGMKKRVLYSSFNHHSLMLIKKIDRAIPIGLLYTEALVDPQLYALRIAAEAVHPFYYTLAVPGTVRKCRENGIMVHPWTVNTQEHMTWMYKEEVNAIITNYPALALDVKKRLNKQ